VPAERKSLAEAVARRYAPAGRFARHYARAKLLRDPVFFALLEPGALPDSGTLVDLGCGQGLLLALLASSGQKPGLKLRGIERDPSDVRRARLALGGDAEIELGDLRSTALPRARVIALVDVIHYLEPPDQEELLARVAEALEDDGVLLLRVCDAHAGLRAWLTRAGDHLGVLTRRGRVGRLHLRGADEWRALLERLGLESGGVPMNQGTPFANVLFRARKAARIRSAERGVVGA